MIGKYSLSGTEARTISSAFLEMMNIQAMMNNNGSYLFHTWQDIRFALSISVRSNPEVDLA